ncbi:uncharacterized protein M6B38_372775 [Iris pallida]|uniref:Uncharacterized protein n=1 Tax=Iris pallida TaxID=29817 RepID=A0AAX6GDB5_IRIPA|nr:uncharacterized protein M6B38_372775 [Iris pallida]
METCQKISHHTRRHTRQDTLPLYCVCSCISAGALAKAMTCALFIEMLLLDRHLLALPNSFPCIFCSY